MNTDITPPTQPSGQEPTAPAGTPVMDVQPPADAPVPAPPEAAPAETDQPAAPQESPKEQQHKAAKPKAPKQPHNGVGFAIAATVVIVLGLAALATYAYLKSR